MKHFSIMTDEIEPKVDELPEDEVPEIEEEYDEEGKDATNWKELALKNQGIAKRFKTKHEKITKEFDEFKAKNPVEEAEPEMPEKSDEPDYAKLAFLEQRGLAHPDDQKLVQEEAARLKLPLTDVLNMEHIKTKLATAKDQREAQAGMPKGRGSASGKTQQDVDYWLQKGETPDDQELAEKVIEARIKKEQQANKFSDELFTG